MRARPTTVRELLSGAWFVHLSCGNCGAYNELPRAMLATFPANLDIRDGLRPACPSCGAPDPAVIIANADDFPDPI